MDAYPPPPPPPPKPNTAEGETMPEERKMKSWSKPVIRRIGETIYVATGPNMKPGQLENQQYVPVSS